MSLMTRTTVSLLSAEISNAESYYKNCFYEVLTATFYVPGDLPEPTLLGCYMRKRPPPLVPTTGTCICEIVGGSVVEWALFRLHNLPE